MALVTGHSNERDICFHCQRSFLKIKGVRRFCSISCRNDYDRTHDSEQPIGAMGKRGFYINCNNCHGRFESLGLRCCSVDCERAYRRAEDKHNRPLEHVSQAQAA